jgi:protein gp37
MIFSINISISTHRAADILSFALQTNYYKGDDLTCDKFIQAMERTDNEEHKKVLVNEVIDFMDKDDFDYYYKMTKRDRTLGIRLIQELNAEYTSGEWLRREVEYERIYERINHRRRIITDIKTTED